MKMVIIKVVSMKGQEKYWMEETKLRLKALRLSGPR